MQFGFRKNRASKGRTLSLSANLWLSVAIFGMTVTPIVTATTHTPAAHTQEAGLLGDMIDAVKGFLGIKETPKAPEEADPLPQPGEGF